MFIKENPHPQNKRVGDCVKRACVLASGINYHDIAIMLNRYRAISGGDKYNSDKNWRGFVINVLLGCDMGNLQYANKGHRYKVYEYALRTKKRAILQVAGHLTTADGNGDYLDTWDCGQKSIYKVYSLPSYDVIVDNIKKNFKTLCKGLTLRRYFYSYKDQRRRLTND